MEVATAAEDILSHKKLAALKILLDQAGASGSSLTLSSLWMESTMSDIAAPRSFSLEGGKMMGAGMSWLADREGVRRRADNTIYIKPQPLLIVQSSS